MLEQVWGEDMTLEILLVVQVRLEEMHHQQLLSANYTRQWWNLFNRLRRIESYLILRHNREEQE